MFTKNSVWDTMTITLLGNVEMAVIDSQGNYCGQGLALDKQYNDTCILENSLKIAVKIILMAMMIMMFKMTIMMMMNK